MDTGLLWLALALACAFEFINGFHDTANAVATVIYTRSLRPFTAVMWSGLCNFFGVFIGGTAVAWSIRNLLPVEVLAGHNVHTSLAVIYAILGAAILWNMATWSIGIPCSSSHTLIGAILGVGLAFTWTHSAAHAVNWVKASEIGLSLLVSPLLGFGLAWILLRLCRAVFSNPALYRAAQEGQTPPLAVRLVLLGTCTGVSLAHGSNDGQKGIGLVMLILAALAPQYYSGQTVPPWVILLVATSLGLGTVVGWKRIVVTIGEKIGKTHLSYAQGACAELVAMSTIGFSGLLGLPVSTTHVLSSGVAGAMVAQQSGLQHKTIQRIASAWLLTLPATMLLSAGFYLILRNMV
jgi:phosphate/sulfate permease